MSNFTSIWVTLPLSQANDHKKLTTLTTLRVHCGKMELSIYLRHREAEEPAHRIRTMNGLILQSRFPETLYPEPIFQNV